MVRLLNLQYGVAGLFTILWVLGFFVAHVGGAFIHLLLVPSFGLLLLNLFPQESVPRLGNHPSSSPSPYDAIRRAPVAVQAVPVEQALPPLPHAETLAALTGVDVLLDDPPGHSGSGAFASSAVTVPAVTVPA